MIITEVTRAATLPQDSSAQRTRDLSALLDLLAAEPAPIRSGALIGLVIEAWQAGFVAARETPVCDFCGEAVVPFQDPHMTRPLWTHKDTMVFGCQGDGFYAGSNYATVRGGGAPEDTAKLDAKVSEPKLHYGDVTTCEACGEQVVYKGRGRFEHCETGYAGQISCYS